MSTAYQNRARKDDTVTQITWHFFSTFTATLLAILVSGFIGQAYAEYKVKAMFDQIEAQNEKTMRKAKRLMDTLPSE